MAVRARDLAEKQFDLQKKVEELESIYDQILDNKDWREGSEL